MPLALHRRRIIPALIALLSGFFCLIAPRIDRTWGRPFRDHGGDLALAAFLYLLAGLFITGYRKTRAAVVFASLAAVELSQLITSIPRHGTLAELTVGSTFDLIDVLAYAVGVLVAFGVEQMRDRVSPG